MYLQLTAGTVITGLWCPRCLLPSVVLVPLSSLSRQGVTTFGPFAYCNGCRGCPQ